MAILGIDEVGRGPIAGPLVVGAVILPKEEKPWFSELRDSKKLSRNKREYLNELILRSSTTGLGWVPAEDIDKIGMEEALKLATRLAVKRVKSFRVPFSEIIIDGNQNFLAGTSLEPYTTTIVKGDDKIREVSAASIIAKVARDDYMIDLSYDYPDYDFEHHVGYGTPGHRTAILAYGLTPEHRRSFEPCRSISGFSPPFKSNKNTTKIGHTAESAVANYLRNHGHRIIEQNHKTPFYEIDLISTKGNHIYFTEVKYRKSSFYGTPIDSITFKKQQQMEFAAEAYLQYQRAKFKNYHPVLAAASVTGNLKKPEALTITHLPLNT